tara:strand:+ start:213 stop:464 length:252 start_codon:yes stop_codon:yes gene_type:complete
VFKKLKAYYEEEPYPTQERMEELAEEFGAPDWTKIENFFKNMQLKHQEQFQRGDCRVTSATTRRLIETRCLRDRDPTFRWFDD